MRLIACTLLVTMTCAASAQAVDYIFREGFGLLEDGMTYYDPGYLSEECPQSPHYWPVDPVVNPCHDARMDVDDPPGSNPNHGSRPGHYSTKQYRLGSYLVGVRNKHTFTQDELLAAWEGTPGVDPYPNCLMAYNNSIFVRYWLYSAENYKYKNHFVELVCGEDRAPTLMEVETCPGGTQRYHLNLNGDGQYHAAVAVGMIAMADPDPCPQQELYHLVVYNGRRWIILDGDYDVHTCDNWNFIQMEVHKSGVYVDLYSKYNDATGECDNPSWRHNERVYTGRREHDKTTKFTAVVMGGLVIEDGDMPPEGERPVGNCWGARPNGGIGNDVSFIDDLEVFNGLAVYQEDPCPPFTPIGACCRYATITCEDDVTEASCGPSAVWYEGQSCSEIDCGCHDPFADADDDGDVDLADFGIWQACLSGNGTAHPPGGSYPCACFNREGSDNDIDENDFPAFMACLSGSMVPALTSCDDGS